MREIKFKAWNISQREMYGNEVALNELYNQSIRRESNNWILLQFTGLWFDNGKTEGYEGDIVEDYTGEERGVITWNYDRWMVKTKTRFVQIGKSDDWKILGNVFQHPELLTAG